MFSLSLDPVLVNYVVVILINIVGFFLGFWVYFDNRKKRTNQTFFLTTAAILMWVNFGFLTNFSPSLKKSLLWSRTNIAIVSLFFVFVYFLSVYFPWTKKRHPLLEKVVVLMGMFFFFSSLLTEEVVRKVSFSPWGKEITGGSLLIPFLGMALFLTLLTLYNLVDKYLSSSVKNRLKLQYFLMGIFFFAGLNLIFNVGAPLIKGSFGRYYQLGDYSSIFFLAFTGVAIAKQKLFGMKIVLSEVLVGGLVTLLLVQVFLSQTYFQILWRMVLLTLFLILGYFLIKSVSREIEQRKKAERLSKELQELNVSLEKRVREKTRKLRERTKELQDKLQKLERFHKLTVGREVRMSELKERIEKLEGKLKKEQPSENED